MESTILKSENFSAWFGEHQVLKNINIEIPRNNIVAVMGPSGCGKTTFIRCINRMHELTHEARVEGEMYFNDENIYTMNPILLRRKIGMVFQTPNPFPTMSIEENIVSGYSMNGISLTKKQRTDRNSVV